MRHFRSAFSGSTFGQVNLRVRGQPSDVQVYGLHWIDPAPLARSVPAVPGDVRRSLAKISSGLNTIENSCPLYITGNDSLASPTSGVLATMSILLLEKIILTEFDFLLARIDTRRTAVRKVSRSRVIRSFASEGITWR